MAREIKTDKRWIKTRKNINDAFLTLLESEDIDKITVKEIVALAEINRNTFYLHYENIYDLLDEIETSIVQDVMGSVESLSLESMNDFKFALTSLVARLMTSNLKVYRPFIKNMNHSKIVSKLKASIEEELTEAFPSLKDDLGFKISFEFLISGILSAYRKWIIDEVDLTIEEINHMVSELVEGVVSSKVISDVIGKAIEQR